MIVRTEQLTFRGAAAGAITAHLDLPEGEPIAYALLAHRFDPSTGAAERISRGLSELGVAVLRLDRPELSEGDLLAAAAALRERHQAPRLLIGHGEAGAAALAVAARIAEARAVATIGAPSDPSRLGDLPELRKALLLLHAPGDLTVPIDHARRVFEAARHPKSFVSLDGADHHLSRHEDAAFAANVLAAWASRYLRQGEAATWMPGERLPPGEGQVVVAETREGAYTQAVQIGSHRLAADEPRRLGGLDAGPAPYDYLLAALGACTSMTIRMYAERKQWPLERAVVRLRHDKIHAEDCADCETKAGKVDHIAREIELQGELSEEQRARLMEIADKCPVHRTLHSEIKIESRLSPPRR